MENPISAGATIRRLVRSCLERRAKGGGALAMACYVFKNLGWMLMLSYQWSVVTGDSFLGEKVCRVWPVNIIGKILHLKELNYSLFFIVKFHVGSGVLKIL